MSTPPSPARNYRRLGYLAIAHALGLLALGAVCLGSGFTDESRWLLRLWVGLVTTWFFWPIILMLHGGRSWRRCVMFVLISLLAFIPSLSFYNRVAPREFGLPWVVSMNPVSMLAYYRAYREGQAAARKDIAAGILAIEESGFGAGSGPGVEILRERYQIEVRPLAGCIVNETIIGHEDGYNSIAGPEIDRRVGRDKVEAAREEGHQIAIARQAAAEQRNKDLAKRFSTLPVDSGLTLKSVSPYSAERSPISPDTERELGNFVQAVEQFIGPLVPKDAPAFDLHISANLTRSAPPKFQTSGSLTIPRPVYDPIYKEIENLPFPQWTQDDLAVSLTFAKAEPR